MKKEILTRKLTTGHLFVFDRSKKNLYLVPPFVMDEWEKRGLDIDKEAMQLIRAGQGADPQFSTDSLKDISGNTMTIVLLGPVATGSQNRLEHVGVLPENALLGISRATSKVILLG